MINPLAALAVLLGLIAIALFFVLLTMMDLKVQRARTGALPPADLQGAALDLIVQCQALEARNEWLEWRQVHCQALVASSIMLAPSRLGMGEKMSIREMQEAP